MTAVDGERGERPRDRRTGPGAESDHGDGRHDGADGHADDGARDPVRPAVAIAEAGGQAPQHEHEGDEGDRLDERLRQGEVGCSVQGEEGGHAVPRHPDEHHGLEALVRQRRGDRTHDHQDADRELGRIVEEHGRARPRAVQRQRHDGRGDEHHEDGREVERQRAALGRRRRARGRAVDARHDADVPVGGAGQERDRLLDGGHPVALPEQQGADRQRDRGQPQGGLETVPQRQVVRLVVAAARREGVGVAGEHRVDGVREETEHETRGGEDDGANRKSMCSRTKSTGSTPFLRAKAPRGIAGCKPW